ncbi:MAG TPA: ferrous iron transport protein B [Candidatus Avirikenella pullistercoris]|nr:ferrous iron transport protein B [Candidatus Avirikenella pullistercoris]
MKLSELKSGQSAIIVKVIGNNAFRRRITEMGFVRGKKVYVIKNAPLKDPIEYELMGYDISLRRKEAEMIEVVSEEEAKDLLQGESAATTVQKSVETVVKERGKEINVALIGNPNSGKTSLFNYISGLNEHVGNYSGVTVDIKVATIEFKGYKINLTDLPGTYSLSSYYSPEELVVRDHIASDKFDIIINVVDASNLERNLYLTTQLIDMDVNMIVALNMYDELLASGDIFDYHSMGKMLGTVFVPTVGKKGKGVPHLLDAIVTRYNDVDIHYRSIRINYGQSVEEWLEKIETQVSKKNDTRYSDRFVSIELLEGEDKKLAEHFNIPEIAPLVGEVRSKIEAEYKEDVQTVLTDARYGFISGALKETLTRNQMRNKQSEIIDTVITHKIWGFPVFIFIMWLIFYGTFVLGEYPMMGIEYLIGELQSFLSGTMNDGAFKDLLIDGIIGGIGSVIVFLPNILLLFLFISILEDSGYMARAAFIMDKLMHKIGLHGKSFIPLVMGFGCNVPAIMATRIIEDRNNRFLTILIAPFMSCSARLPVYLLIIGAFFPENAGNMLFLIYFLGILVAIFSALLFKKVLFTGKDQPFVMELPPYRVPSARSTLRHMWMKGSQYLRKMGGIILVAVVIVWALGYYPSRESSYLDRFGKTIEPAVAPLGFDWKIGVGLISGVAAKEVVVSTLGVINHIDASDESGEMQLAEQLKNDVYESGPKKGEKVFTKASAFSLLMFVLIYFPCVAAIAAIKKETGAWKWALFTVVYTTGLAWIVSFIIYQIFG